MSDIGDMIGVYVGRLILIGLFCVILLIGGAFGLGWWLHG